MKIKNIIFFIATFTIFSSCITRYHELSNNFDYRDHVNNGFTISHTEYGNNYTTLGQLERYYYEGKKNHKYNDIEKRGNGLYYPTSKRLIDGIVNDAKELGANGIVLFKIEYLYKDRCYKATGTAVKINR